jgi:NAD(P)-dependent dehydrogenase (short-subunit alcohol dehydrogenase family)
VNFTASLPWITTEMIHYGMTKTAQLAVARGLAETLVCTGVTVNSVVPGPTASEGVGDDRSGAPGRRRRSEGDRVRCGLTIRRTRAGAADATLDGIARSRSVIWSRLLI